MARSFPDGYPADQAQDLTQEFFIQVLEGRYLDRADINDRGQIAGSGVLSNGDTHAFLLIPCGQGVFGMVPTAVAGRCGNKLCSTCESSQFSGNGHARHQALP